MKYYRFLLLAFIFSAQVHAQTWQPVGGNILGNDIHGFGIWNNQLAMGGSFNNNPCDKIAIFDSLNWTCPAGGINIVVRSVIAWNGNLVAVGDFWNNFQPCTNCNGVAMWDGTNWTNLGTGFNNDVLCLTVWNGNLVAGGDFTTADGNTCNRVAMWNGTNWSAIGGLDTAFNNDVRVLAVYNNQLWVGGDFTNVNGCTACDRIVKWNGNAWVGGNSGVDIPGGLDSTVRVLYVDQAANRLYMGGHFLEVGGNTNASGIAVYDGNSWSALGTGVNSYVRAITKYNGNIIAGGDFTTADAITANRVAKWNPATLSWSAMGAGMNDYIRALIPYKGELYAGGAFTQADNQSRGYIAKWYEVPAIPPVAAFTANTNPVCAGQCIGFTDNSSNSPTSWSWTFSGASTTSSTQQNPTSICYNTPGVYPVMLTVTNANGSNTNTQTITVVAAPSADAGQNTSICIGSSTVLSATGGSNYSWTPATGLSATTGATVTATPSATTTYTVTVANSAGCTSTDTVTVNVSNVIPAVSATGGGTICAGSSASLTASGAAAYLWSPGSLTGPTVVVTPSSTTTYTVTGTDPGGCSDTAMLTVIVDPAPVAFAGADVTICTGEPVTLNATGGVSYLWSPATGLSCSNCPSPVAAPSSTITYTVTVTGSNGCQASDAVMVIVDPCTGIEEATNENINIYSNPLGTSVLTIETPATFAASNCEFILMDITGRVLRNVALNHPVTTLERGYLASGIYLWMTSIDGRIEGKGKLVIE